MAKKTLAQAIKQYEGSGADKRIDKARGTRENSAADQRQDRAGAKRLLRRGK